MADGPPIDLLAATGIKLRPGNLEARHNRLWIAEAQGIRAVLRRLDPTVYRPMQPVVRAQMDWNHSFLAALAKKGFPCPEPIPVFASGSWCVHEDAVWDVVSYLPGSVIGTAKVPSMAEVGAWLARYHAASSEIALSVQAPLALPLIDVPAALHAALDAHPTWGTEDDQQQLRNLADELAPELDELGGGETLVIHGDFTNHNVLAKGDPPKPTGVIDFELAHLDRREADLAYGLWRSARPDDLADELDPQRIGDFLRGYLSVGSLAPEAVLVILVYLRGRGLQMMTKRVRLAHSEYRPINQVRWVRDHHRQLKQAIESAFRSSSGHRYHQANLSQVDDSGVQG